MFVKRLGVMAAGVALAAVTFQSDRRSANALPLFARRLGVACSTCHTSPPRLNETGYQFRAAGFRMPNEIGKAEDKPFKITDYSGVRIQMRYDGVRSTAGPETVSDNKFNLFALELYPFYGPIGNHLSSNLKLTIWPDKSEETEGHVRLEGNLKLTYGNEKRFFEVRGGVPHPMEGFGASDTIIGDTRPYFWENPANFNQSTFFTPWNFHQAGATFGYYQGRTAIRALVLNGVRLHDDHGKLEPFGSKEPFTHVLPGSKHNGPDVQVFVNRILDARGGGVSVYYYHGDVTLPINSHGVAGKIEEVKTFQNHFNRVAAFGSYPVNNRLNILAGFQRGRDDIATGGRFSSGGVFTEGMVMLNDLTAAGVRYDWFDPARNKNHNEVNAVTAYVNAWIKDQIRIVAEYRHLDLKRGLLPSQKNNAVQVRLIYIK